MNTPISSVRYDAAVIEKMGTRVLKRASSWVVSYVLLGLLLGLIPLIAGQVADLGGGMGGTLSIVGLLLFAAIGYAIGSERAFSLRLQAHLLLCQVSIERNTAWMVQALSAQRHS